MSAANIAAAPASAANIASALPRMAASQPSTPAIVMPPVRGRSAQLTYAQLDATSDLIAHGLAALGIRRGTRAVLMVKPSLELFTLTFAMFKAGVVPVMIDPGLGIKNVGPCLAEVEPQAFIGIPPAQLARKILGWGKRSVEHVVTVGPRLLWGGHTLAQVIARGRAEQRGPALADTRSDELAAILFTSGSTGVPKGTEYLHGHFVAQVEMIRELYDIRPGEVDLPTFPLFALFDPALGMTTIIPDMDASRPAQVDPQKIFAAIERHQVTNMFGSPALLDRVSRAGVAQQQKLPTLRRVISAGAPVTPAILERFTAMLPADTEIHTPYGATEALPVASVGSRFLLDEARAKTHEGAGVCVGRPHPRQQVRVIRISDEPIARWSDDLLVPTGEIGEIVVRGPSVTQAYYGRPQSNALAKVAHDDGGPVSHRMGDLGYFDGDGRLWFCGRKSQRVVNARGTFHTVPIEEVMNAHPDVKRTALVGVGEQLVLCVELEPATREQEQRPWREVEPELRTLAAQRPLTQPLDRFLVHPGFPVDIRHNAKIFREKLAVWAAAQGAGA